MSSHFSPDQNNGQALSQPSQSQSPEAAVSGSEQSKSSSPLDILKNLVNKTKPRSDGSAPKRRGPKPDSKPAMTRRQELNRQAQRTHRERKELYVRALEEEVMRLKESYAAISQDKTKLADENKLLKDLLGQYGVPFPSNMGPDDPDIGPQDGNHFGSGGGGGGGGGGGSSNMSGYVSQGVFSPGGMSQSSAPSMSSSGAPFQQHPTGQQLQNMTQQASTATGLDYTQAGVDFVLTLERPCMDHIDFLLERGTEYKEEFCGHALMASCPPKPFDQLDPTSSFGQTHIHSNHVDSGQQTWEISKADLSRLMDLSSKIDLDGEMTPVMAWALVMSHPRFVELTLADLDALTIDLGSKVKCHGFGAVTEEFEVRDAIENVFSSRPEVMAC